MMIDKEYLKLNREIQLKIFFFKMSKLFKDLRLSTWYLPNLNMSTGQFGSTQLFKVNGDIYLYSPNPYGFAIKRVLGIYDKDNYTFMILERKDGFYEVQKDNFIHYHIFKSFNECKKYIEDF